MNIHSDMPLKILIRTESGVQFSVAVGQHLWMTVNTGIFYAINSGSMPVYSEDKAGFVKGGTFVPAIDEKYMA